MTPLTPIFASAIIGYAAGLVPSSRIAASSHGRSPNAVRESGTQNPGALNSAHTLGKGWGLAVLSADVAKGVVAAKIGRTLGGAAGANTAAAAAVAGHCFPATRDFRGGKGVATSVGQVVATFPAYLPIDIAVGAATVALPFWKQRTMAANTVASLVWVATSAVAWRRPALVRWGPSPTAAVPIAAAVSSAIILKRFIDERDTVASHIQMTSSGSSIWSARQVRR